MCALLIYNNQLYIEEDITLNKINRFHILYMGSHYTSTKYNKTYISKDRADCNMLHKKIDMDLTYYIQDIRECKMLHIKTEINVMHYIQI